jgi:hypothetical protein
VRAFIPTASGGEGEVSIVRVMHPAHVWHCTRGVVDGTCRRLSVVGETVQGVRSFSLAIGCTARLRSSWLEILPSAPVCAQVPPSIPLNTSGRLSVRGSGSIRDSAVMSCGAMSCYVMLCNVVPCHVVPCHVMLCYVMSCGAMSCRVMWCHVMPCHVMSCHVMSCYVKKRIIIKIEIKNLSVKMHTGTGRQGRPCSSRDLLSSRTRSAMRFSYCAEVTAR